MENMIDRILNEYKDHFGHDHLKYRNHALRVYRLCLLMDEQAGNNEKYAIAAAFHDLGIWTHKTFDYLNPSIQLLQQWLEKEHKTAWVAEISLMIDNHHKLSRYTGEHARTVETFRKADWIDLTFGWLRFGLPRKTIKQAAASLPTKGFHRFLLKKTIKNFFLHPLQPLPMFKK